MMIIRHRYAAKNTGLLLLRVGIGFMFILHGWPKMMGGAPRWEMIGQSMELFGVGFAPMFWGFMAAFAETVGGLLLMLGLLFRPACFLLFITMLVAAAKHAFGGDGFGGYSHALEAAIVFFSLLFIGPGKYSLDYNFFRSEKDRNKYR
ncbi:DoxX family protein [Pontibacter arcticus]|uniref:DoxX family protein n=1 Tax=Pontibacter arcticus TaxID=2080288 RepID=A0A364RDX5_9BACT|nr:DoxX family protein [Pontibacter arcticus]RAU82445.1 DoxX family protein [Pontibacter arcticus]